MEEKRGSTRRGGRGREKIAAGQGAAEGMKRGDDDGCGAGERGERRARVRRGVCGGGARGDWEERVRERGEAGRETGGGGGERQQRVSLRLQELWVASQRSRAERGASEPGPRLASPIALLGEPSEMDDGETFSSLCSRNLLIAHHRLTLLLGPTWPLSLSRPLSFIPAHAHARGYSLLIHARPPPPLAHRERAVVRQPALLKQHP
eukprot:scaffold117570_cov26-Tisochrysis_lutea.AAC.2